MSERGSPLLLVSVSARALACSAARAGLRTLAADLFADLDTRAAADATRVVAPGRPGFDTDSLQAAVAALDPRGRAPLVYGSGFDATPWLLERLTARRRLLGNPAAVVDAVKQPERLAALLASLGIPHPPLSLPRPDDPARWLRKRIGGAGGGHVRVAREDDTATDGSFFQRRVDGVPTSATLLSDGRRTRLLGYSRQLCAEQFPARPYLYGGGLGMHETALPAALRASIEEAAVALAAASGLVGLWCMDLVVDGTRWWLIEVNPRPGATSELHEREHSLFALHVAACEGRLPAAAAGAPAGTGLRGMRVVYARAPLGVPAVDAWPSWISDRPPAGTRVEAGEPLCTVHAEGADETTLLATLQTRLQQVERLCAAWREAVA